jgi:hypothetical protein
VLIYRFDADKGSLIANDPPFAAVQPGAGPRHFAFHPTGRFAYLINETDVTLTVFSSDPERGGLTAVQTLSTLPVGQAVEPGFSTADVHVPSFRKIPLRVQPRARQHRRVRDRSEDRTAHPGSTRVDARQRAARLRGQVETLLSDLRDALHGVQLLGHCPPRALDLAASFGERLSALIVAAYLDGFRPACFVDAREIIVTDDHFTSARVAFGETNRLIRRYFTKLLQARRRPPVAVVTGFIASTNDGQTTTLGRDGSDYTAAILGAALGASAIEIWTDVDGVLSADPRKVPAAFVLPPGGAGMWHAELAALGDDDVLLDVSSSRAESSTVAAHARIWSRGGVLLATTEQLEWFR